MNNFVKVSVEYACEDGSKYHEQRMIPWSKWMETLAGVGRTHELEEVGRMIADIFENGRQHDGE